MSVPAFLRQAQCSITAAMRKSKNVPVTALSAQEQEICKAKGAKRPNQQRITKFPRHVVQGRDSATAHY